MDSRTFIIYMHISPSNKRYIGITYRKPKYRWGVDGRGYKDNEYFWRAIQKYGWDNFTHEIIADNLSYGDACKLEVELITKYKTTNEKFGYNLSSGGELSALGCKRTQVQREHYSLSKLGNKNPQYGKSSWNKGVPMSEESKRKISISKTGKPSKNKGRKLSDEVKQHLHDVNIGKIHITNGEIEKIICIEDLENYTKLGYVRGRKKYVKKGE